MFEVLNMETGQSVKTKLFVTALSIGRRWVEEKGLNSQTFALHVSSRMYVSKTAWYAGVYVRKIA